MKKSSYRAVTQCFYFVLSRNQQISRRRSLLCGISSSCGELLWTFTKRKAEPILEKKLHPVVGQWWWIGHCASLGFKARLRFAISLVLKVNTFATRKWPFQKQFLAPTVVQRMQFCQYIFQIISENHIFLRVLPNYHQTGTKTLMDQKKTDWTKDRQVVEKLAQQLPSCFLLSSM